MRHKLFAGAALTMALVLAPAGTAWADHCVNLSRGAANATPWETTTGRWSYIAPDVGSFWVFDTPDGFHAGTADALLEGSGACNAARLQGQTKGDLTIDSLKGIWSEDCVNEAAGF